MIARQILKLTPKLFFPKNTFFWGPRFPFDGLEREFHRIEDEFRRLNKEIKHSLGEVNPFSQDRRLSIASPQNRAVEKEQTYIDKEGKKKLQLGFDFTHFKPEDIKLKVEGHKITISAKNTEKSEKGSIYREFYREYTLPDNVDIDQIKSSLGPDGTLMLEAPFRQIESGKSTHVEIPIEKNIEK